MIRYSRIISIVAALSTAPFLLACAEEATPEQTTEEIGSFSAAISTVGSDGATYSFPLGTYLRVVAPTWSQYFPLDGGGTTFTQDLPAGDYTLELYFPSDPHLMRTDGSSTTEVSALWTDAQPFNVHVASGLTTPVVLHFDAAGLEDITFIDGSLLVEIQVDEYEGAEQPETVQEDGYLISSGVYDSDPTQPWAVALATTAGYYYYQGVTLQATGPWQEVGNWSQVCVPIQVASLSTYGDDGMSRRLLQMAGATGELCIWDYGASDYFQLSLTQTGPAPADQVLYLPEADYTRQFYFWGYNFQDVYDGTTLRQSQLASWVTPSSTDTYFSHSLYNADFTTYTSTSGNFSGRLRLQP